MVSLAAAGTRRPPGQRVAIFHHRPRHELAHLRDSPGGARQVLGVGVEQVARVDVVAVDAGVGLLEMLFLVRLRRGYEVVEVRDLGRVERVGREDLVAGGEHVLVASGDVRQRDPQVTEHAVVAEVGEAHGIAGLEPLAGNQCCADLGEVRYVIAVKGELLTSAERASISALRPKRLISSKSSGEAYAVARVLKERAPSTNVVGKCILLLNGVNGKDLRQKDSV